MQEKSTSSRRALLTKLRGKGGKPYTPLDEERLSYVSLKLKRNISYYYNEGYDYHIECSRLSRFPGFRFQRGILCKAELH